MAISIQFVVSESSKSVFKAAGLNKAQLSAGPWPLVAGDVICFPEARTLFWRVISRLYVPKPAPSTSAWFLLLEHCDDPMKALEKPMG